MIFFVQTFCSKEKTLHEFIQIKSPLIITLIILIQNDNRQPRSATSQFKKSLCINQTTDRKLNNCCNMQENVCRLETIYTKLYVSV